MGTPVGMGIMTGAMQPVGMGIIPGHPGGGIIIGGKPPKLVMGIAMAGPMPSAGSAG